jgi:hypothetical protein
MTELNTLGDNVTTYNDSLVIFQADASFSTSSGTLARDILYHVELLLFVNVPLYFLRFLFRALQNHSCVNLYRYLSCQTSAGL